MIRRASESDINDIVDVINLSNYTAYKYIIPPEYFKHPVVVYEDIRRDMEVMEFYVYEYYGKIVGVAALHPIYSEGVGIVRYVYIHPGFQRRGMGTELMNHIEDIAFKRGLKRLRLVTHEKAIWAIAFYRKLGYRIAGYRYRAAWCDVILEKLIQPP